LVPLSSVDAQAGGFIPCNGPDCTACDLVSMINRIIIWLFGIVFVIFAIMMVIAGFGLVTSKGNQSALDAAKDKFQNAIIGIIIMMAAWLIVDTLLRGILAGGGGNVLGFGPWSQVQCYLQTEPDRYEGGAIINEGTMPTTPTNPNPTNPVTPTGQLVSYAGYQFDQAILANVQHLDNNFNLRVSGGHRTAERNREVNGSPTSHHLTGRAADFVGSQAEMQAGANWARANGAREAFVHNAGSGTHLHVSW
jgi:hypothetical protein